MVADVGVVTVVVLVDVLLSGFVGPGVPEGVKLVGVMVVEGKGCEATR